MESGASRPIFLNLFRIRLPVGGVVSILHRISGVLLTLMIPALLYFLQRLLADPAAYIAMNDSLRHGSGKWILLFVVWLLTQHFFSGLRHLLLDIDVGIEKNQARRLAWATLFASGFVVVVVGLSL